MSMNLPKGANLNWKWNLVLFFFFLFVIFTLFTFRICVLFSFFCVFFAHLVRARMVQICVSAIYIWFFRVMSRKFRVIHWNIPFSGRTNVSPAILSLQMLGPFMNSNFFQKIFGARRALEKRASFSSVAKSGRNKKTFLQKCGNWQKKIFGLTEIFVKYF